MGKVLRVGLVVAAVGINFIPGVGQAISGSLVAGLSGTAVGAGGTFAALGVAQAVVNGLSALGVVAGFGIAAKALGLGPKHTRINPATASLPPLLRERLSRPAFGGVTIGAGTRSARRGMFPIRSRLHLRRWQISQNSGDCMFPHCPISTSYTLLDREAEIRPDDLVTFLVKRRHGGGRVGLTKRFVTATDTHFEFESTNPDVESYRIPREHVAWLYRNRAHLRGPQDWSRRVSQIAGDPSAHNERLGICVFSDALLA